MRRWRASPRPPKLQCSLPLTIQVLVFSNFELSATLKQLLHRTMAEVNCGDMGRAYDDGALRRLLAMQQECLAAFDACVREDKAKARQQPRVEARASTHAIAPPSSTSCSGKGHPNGNGVATAQHAKDE